MKYRSAIPLTPATFTDDLHSPSHALVKKCAVAQALLSVRRGNGHHSAMHKSDTARVSIETLGIAETKVNIQQLEQEFVQAEFLDYRAPYQIKQNPACADRPLICRLEMQ